MFIRFFLIVSCYFLSGTILYSQYTGGVGNGGRLVQISGLACSFSIDESILIYKGGKSNVARKLEINNSNCSFSIDESILIYRGGKSNIARRLAINNTNCLFQIDESVLIYRGGKGNGANKLNISPTTCPIPESDNIFFGGTSSSGIISNLIANPTAYTSGPFISTNMDTTIVNGNCITLNTSGSGATSYSWSPTNGLSNPAIQNPIAKPNTTTTYTVTATGSSIGCRDVAKVTITVLGAGVNTSVTYPSKICISVSTLQAPTVIGITGGTFSSNNTNLKIDAITGQINPSTSLAGIYTVTYTYGSCNDQVTSTVEITNDCNTNEGVVIYPSIYLGGIANTALPSNSLIQSACTPNLDYAQLIFKGGEANTALPSNSLIQAACIPNLDYTQLIYKGGIANTNPASNMLLQAACTPNLDYTQLIYKGGQASSNIPSSPLQQLACSIPVGDNFYLGGSGVGYGNGSLTPTTNAVTGTVVAVSSDVTVCPGIPITLNASGASTYTWSPATGLSNSLVANPIATPSVTTTYTVVGSGAGVGCINTAKVTVIVQNDLSTSVSYGGYNFDEADLNLKKVKYINGPLTGTFSFSPTGLSFNIADGSFTPGLSTSGIYAIKYDYTKGACDYSYTTNINITKLPPTISYTNNAKFYINYNGVTLSPNITGGEAVVFETLDALPTGLSFNISSGVISGTPTQLVDNQVLRIRAANYKKDNTINWGETFSLTLSVKQPVINLEANSISSLNTTYGIPSATQNVNVVADNIINHVLVIAPAGFETSVLTNSGFADTTKMYPTAERNINQPLYVRLKKTTNVGNHDGTIQLITTSAVAKSITTSTSYVAPATLTVTGKYFQKFYGSRINLGVGSKYFTATGLMNNETIGSVTLAASGGTAIDDAVGYYTITPSAATGGTFSSSNYNITYNAGQFQVVYSLYNFNMSGSNSNWVKGTVPIPKITNLIVSNITKSSATIAGKIPSSYVNIEEYGICYSTTINPKITDQKIANGSSIPGSFSFNLTGLSMATKYFVRAYITIGNTTFYSPNMRFKTLNPSIGEAYLGGKLAYILKAGDPGYDPDVLHGIIAASSDNPSLQWGCVGSSINGANGTAIGTGLQNTNDIVSLCGSTTNAAYYSADLVFNGYSDWFLPSKDEMLILYNARTEIGNFNPTGWYLTSSQYSNNYAWIVDFAANPTQGRLHGDWKDWSLLSRAIRYF